LLSCFTSGAFAQSLANALGFGLDFPIFTSLNDVAGSAPGVGSLIGTKNTVGVHLVWWLDDWTLTAGGRFPLRESTPFASSQTVVANPTIFFLDGSSGLSWLEFSAARNFPLFMNKIMTFIPSVGLDYQPRITGSIPTVATQADFSPLFATLGVSFRLALKNNFFLTPGFRWGVDVLSFISNPVNFSTLASAQQIIFAVEAGYAYGN
jgi:hypothetical protein